MSGNGPEENDNVHQIKSNDAGENDNIQIEAEGAAEDTSVDVKPVIASDVKEETSQDPFAYLDRRDFTSEKYKVEIRGLPKFYGFGELKKLMTETLRLSCTKVKPPRRGCSWAYACFRTEEERSRGLEILNGYVWKKSTLSARPAQAAPDPLVRQRMKRQKMDGFQQNQGFGKKRKFEEDNTMSQEERLKNNVCPYWNVPYEEQKRRKTEGVKEILRNLGRELVKCNPDLSPWLEEQKAKNDGLPCALLDLRSASLIDGYRNKCEFSVGLNPQTKNVTVGFRLGSYLEGSVGVAPVTDIPHVPSRMKEVAEAMENFIAQTGRSPYNHETHEGFWRQIMVRLGSATGELLLAVGMHPQDMNDEELKTIKTDLITYFTSGAGASCKLDSLYFQSLGSRKPQSQQPPFEHLWGQTHIHDTILGLKFRISPEAFFQINTEGAEQLYQAIGDVAGLSTNTSLLDVCCGTGTIGLCLSKKCGEVLGVELNEEAVNDAKFNATANNVENCSFHAGRAEDILNTVIQTAANKELVAVVDPPRAGLHPKAVVTLRRTQQIQRLVYVSCDPKGATKNFVDLGRPPSKNMRGLAMVPVKAIPVDMFPHTKLCELVIYFERIDTRTPEERYVPES